MANRNSRTYICCPVCGKLSKLYASTQDYYYECVSCGWRSDLPDKDGKKTLDLYSGDLESGCLSNLFPYKFDFYMEKYNIPFFKPIKCASMESFIQGLKIRDAKLQREFMENISGKDCIKLKATFEDWQKEGCVYLNGSKIDRFSTYYNEIIETAYDCLYLSNIIFREISIPYASRFHLIHSIGKNDPSETLLTEEEFIAEIKRLIEKYKKEKS